LGGIGDYQNRAQFIDGQTHSAIAVMCIHHGTPLPMWATIGIVV